MFSLASLFILLFFVCSFFSFCYLSCLFRHYLSVLFRPSFPLSLPPGFVLVNPFMFCSRLPCLPSPYPLFHILSLFTLLSLIPIHSYPYLPFFPFSSSILPPFSLSIHLSLVPANPSIPCPYPPFPPFSLSTHPSIPSPRPSSSASRLRQLKQRHKWRPVINVSRPRFNTSAASPVLVRGSGAAVYYLREPRSLKALDKPGSRSPQA